MYFLLNFHTLGAKILQSGVRFTKTAFRAAQVLTHGLTGGVLSKLQGGSFSEGFKGAALGKLITIGTHAIGSKLNIERGKFNPAQFALVTGAGYLVGGKMGARMAALGYLFNHLSEGSAQKGSPYGGNPALTDPNQPGGRPPFLSDNPPIIDDMALDGISMENAPFQDGGDIIGAMHGLGPVGETVLFGGVGGKIFRGFLTVTGMIDTNVHTNLGHTRINLIDYYENSGNPGVCLRCHTE